MVKRRTFLKSSLGIPALPLVGTYGLAGCAGDDTPNPYLAGNFGPVALESTITDLQVTGTIPQDLAGRFLRNGPNPHDPDAGSYHWFTGRGMVHGLRLKDGRAEWYRNRYVSPDGGPNTSVIGHGGRTLAIVEAGTPPHEMGYTLDPMGENTSFGGGFSAHPKYDPDTGELHAMCYAPPSQSLRYVVVDADGEWEDETEIPVTGMPMVHDMSLTKNYAVVFDLPVTVSLLALGGGADFPFRWDPDHEPRVGLLPRGGSADEIIWRSVGPNYSYHPMNAYEDEAGNVVIDICRYETMFKDDIRGPFGDSLPRLDRWTINPNEGVGNNVVREDTIDDRPQEFPRHHPDLNSKPYRYGYAVAVTDYQAFPSIYKHDLQAGTTTQHDVGPGRHSAEPVFVPREGSSDEDDGYIITFVYDANTDSSDLVILDARDMSRPALATVHIPVRVPFGFHGNWVPDSVVAPA